MNLFLLLSAIVILACVLCNRLSNKLGVPTLLAFILLGMFFGCDGVVKIPFENYTLAQNICSVALIFIMFYGGNWAQARPVAVKATVLSSLGTLGTAGLVGLFCWKVLGLEMLLGFLLGAVIASTDAASTTGPSATGSENGTPTSMTSAPLSSSSSMTFQKASGEGYPAVTKGMSAVRPSAEASRNFFSSRCIVLFLRGRAAENQRFSAFSTMSMSLSPRPERFTSTRLPGANSSACDRT